MKLTCECCGFEQEFKDGGEAYEAGWDAPPRFSFVTCNLCPAVCIVLGKGHKLAHALWAAEGRPKAWTFAKCATDDHFGNPKLEKEFEDSFDQFLSA